MFADAHLYAADTPYVDLYAHGMHICAPFRHTLRLHTPQPDAHWTFEGLDPDEFPPDETRVRPWEWILDLDEGYGHRTMLSCLHSTLHGTRLRVHAPKNYRGTHRSVNLDLSLGLDDKQAAAVHEEVLGMLERLEALFPTRVTHEDATSVRPLGVVCVYPTQATTYRHE